MLKKRWLLLMVILLTFSLVLAACGDPEIHDDRPAPGEVHGEEESEHAEESEEHSEGGEEAVEGEQGSGEETPAEETTEGEASE